MGECCNCKYWLANASSNGAYGRCRLFPKWIETHRYHECGQFESKAGKQE